MGLLDSLLGGAQGQATQDFLKRYEQGGQVSAEEAEQHYGRVTSGMAGDDYREAAEQALSRLSPDQRAELLSHLQGQARSQDVNFPGLHEAQPHDTGGLASLFSAMHQQQPGMLQRLLGGGGADPSQPRGSALGKVALAGIAAIGLRKMMKR
jgi:hypothetical protein